MLILLQNCSPPHSPCSLLSVRSPGVLPGVSVVVVVVGVTRAQLPVSIGHGLHVRLLLDSSFQYFQVLYSMWQWQDHEEPDYLDDAAAGLCLHLHPLLWLGVPPGWC